MQTLEILNHTIEPTTGLTINCRSFFQNQSALFSQFTNHGTTPVQIYLNGSAKSITLPGGNTQAFNRGDILLDSYIVENKSQETVTLDVLLSN
jgi:hypothetical protein